MNGETKANGRRQRGNKANGEQNGRSRKRGRQKMEQLDDLDADSEAVNKFGDTPSPHNNNQQAYALLSSCGNLLFSKS